MKEQIDLCRCCLLLLSCQVVYDSFVTPWTAPSRFLCPWTSPEKNITVGSHFLLQGIFPTQEIEPGSPTFLADSLPS